MIVSAAESYLGRALGVNGRVEIDYHTLGIDVGDKDGLKEDAVKFHAALDRYGIANGFEIYPGDHTSGVAMRVQEKMIPFFSSNLAFSR